MENEATASHGEDHEEDSAGHCGPQRALVCNWCWQQMFTRFSLVSFSLFLLYYSVLNQSQMSESIRIQKNIPCFCFVFFCVVQQSFVTWSILLCPCIFILVCDSGNWSAFHPKLNPSPTRRIQPETAWHLTFLLLSLSISKRKQLNKYMATDCIVGCLNARHPDEKKVLIRSCGDSLEKKFHG